MDLRQIYEKVAEMVELHKELNPGTKLGLLESAQKDIEHAINCLNLAGVELEKVSSNTKRSS